MKTIYGNANASCYAASWCVMAMSWNACIVVVAAIEGTWSVLSAGIGFVMTFAVLFSIASWPRYQRWKPALTVSDKLAKFEIPQLFLTARGWPAGLPRPYWTVIANCHWELTNESRTLIVTTRLPIWGLVKVRFCTEWHIPEGERALWQEWILRLGERQSRK